MDSAKLNDWLQVLGIFAVVASLIFVGLQMRQDQAIAIAAQYQERYATALDYWISVQSDEVEQRRLGENRRASAGLASGMDEAITASEYGSRWISVKKAVLVWDNQHYQYESGFLSEDAWNTYVARIARSGSNPMFQLVFMHDRDFYRASFVSVIDDTWQEIDR